MNNFTQPRIDPNQYIEQAKQSLRNMQIDIQYVLTYYSEIKRANELEINEERIDANSAEVKLRAFQQILIELYHDPKLLGVDLSNYKDKSRGLN